MDGGGVPHVKIRPAVRSMDGSASGGASLPVEAVSGGDG